MRPALCDELSAFVSRARMTAFPPIPPPTASPRTCSAFLRVGSAVHTDLSLLRSQFGIECDRSYVDLQAGVGGIDTLLQDVCERLYRTHSACFLSTTAKPPAHHHRTCCHSDWPGITGGRVAAWDYARSRTNFSDESCAKTRVSGAESIDCCIGHGDDDVDDVQCAPGDMSESHARYAGSCGRWDAACLSGEQLHYAAADAVNALYKSNHLIGSLILLLACLK